MRPRPATDQAMIARLLRSWLDRQRRGDLWRLVADTAWEHRWSYAAAAALMGVVAAMGGAVALTVERVTDEVFFAERGEALGIVAGWVMAIFLIRGAAMYGQTLILTRIGNRVVADLQSRLHAHVLRQGLAFHGGEDSGALATRMTHSAMAARQVLRLVATRLGVDLMSVLVLVGVMVWQDWRLSLVALVGMPAVFGAIAALLARVRRLARAEVTLNARILAATTETVAGARVIRAFGLEETMRRRMDASIHGVRERADRIARLQALVNPLTETVSGFAAAGVILYGGWRVAGQTMEPGTFFSFLTALMMAADPARRLAQLSVQLRRHMAGVAYLHEALDSHTDLPVAPGAPPLAPGPGEIRLEGVRFAYPGGEGPALHGLDLTAPAGRVTALVGPSGAGKSTVLALIERFYDPDAGRVTIDGQDIRAVTPESLRARLALVAQETFLFDMTVAENIGLGRPGASRAEIEAAARAAEAHGFVAALERGYDTALGEGGSRLSGGQRQRLAIARAMLRDAPILLLDEATSALDAESEAHVQEALARLMAGRTTIVIAHRLATVRRAHQIAVMDNGAVVETGNHDTLMAAGGLYARLAALQFGSTEAEA